MVEDEVSFDSDMLINEAKPDITDEEYDKMFNSSKSYLVGKVPT